MRLPFAPRHATVRKLAAPLIGGVLLACTLGAPAVAAPSATHAKWTASERRHEITRGHVASAAAAAKLAHRATVTLKRPLLSVKIDHRSTTLGPLSTMRSASPTPRIVFPDLTNTLQVDGLAQAESGNAYPPDPWVAVNSAYVVQVVNSMVRVSNRAGTELQMIPTWLLFGLTADQFASDSRIIWDAVHGRWVGVALSFNGDASSNFLRLAVSDGADPTAGWSTYSFYYGDNLPDYPSIASSNDKIVLTDNLFDGSSNFAGAELVTVTWASVLLGITPTPNFCLGPYVHPRAAQALSSGNDVHLIMESVFNGHQWYYRLIGAGNCDSVAQVVDGTDLSGLGPFALPPDPRQTPADTIGSGHSAVDERPTDAIWQNNHLWWVSTYPISYDLGLTYNDAVVLWNATTVPSSGSPTAGTPVVISAGNGVDDFMGGIGMTRGGTLVVVYSESTSTDPVSIWANQIPSGGSLGTAMHIDDGDASYGAERWGDFAGVAMDPVGTGSVWATHEVAAGDGTWRTDVFRLVADNDSPSLPGVPTASIGSPTGLTSTVPVKVIWAAATDGMSNVARYDVVQSIDLGAFVDLGGLAGTSMTRPMLFGHTYRFGIRAVDAVGNVGSWRVSSTLRPYLYQQTSGTVYTGTWGTSTGSAYSGGSVRFASTAGRYATFTTTTARSIAIVTTKAPSRGSFKVYVDNVYKGTISTYSPTTKYRQLVFQYAWSTPGTHKIKIYVVGTSGHPRVDVDAFVVLR